MEERHNNKHAQAKKQAKTLETDSRLSQNHALSYGRETAFAKALKNL